MVRSLLDSFIEMAILVSDESSWFFYYFVKLYVQEMLLFKRYKKNCSELLVVANTAAKPQNLATFDPCASKLWGAAVC